LHRIRLNERNKTGEQDTLCFEARLVVRIGNNEEDVAEEVEQVLLVELIGDFR